MTRIIDRIQNWFSPSFPREMNHDHNWSNWESRTKSFLFWGQNWESDRNRPYIDIVAAEKRWCQEEQCVATEWRNEKKVRQYFEIAEEEVLDDDR